MAIQGISRVIPIVSPAQFPNTQKCREGMIKTINNLLEEKTKKHKYNIIRLEFEIDALNKQAGIEDIHLRLDFLDKIIAKQNELYAELQILAELHRQT